jgi:hypothetical protein
MTLNFLLFRVPILRGLYTIFLDWQIDKQSGKDFNRLTDKKLLTKRKKETGCTVQSMDSLGHN